MCKQCETKPVYEFTNKRKVCKKCYTVWFRKKFFATIRKYKMLNKGDKVIYQKGNTAPLVVLDHMMNLLQEKFPFEVVNNLKNADKIVLPSSTDGNAYSIISEIVNFNTDKIALSTHLPKDKKIIKPLFFFLRKEIELYAKLQRLKYRKTKIKKEKIKKFVDDLEKKHPEVKRSIVSSYLEISNTSNIL